ncbi:MAG: hypothetical protein J1F35_02210 [Erysipelotrichales bacterium]|nr:hypothetical protein [Erysipelotrichales bacterium]
MRIDRIMGVVLSILIFSFYTIKHIDIENDNNPFELIGDNGFISENVVNLDDKVLSDNSSYSNIIEYKNTNNYPVELNKNDITIKCTGTGSTKEEDEYLVSNNYIINAKFSEEKNSTLYNSLLVPKGRTIYIYIISEYNGPLPTNQVSCDYSVNITSS